MRPDGSDIRNLTNTPEINEGLPRFSPDGTRILYRRIPIGERFDNNRHGMQGELGHHEQRRDRRPGLRKGR